MPSALNPLPSLIRASAHDAGSRSMRKANRAVWNDDDWNAMCAMQERLIRACYGEPSDHNDPNVCYIRFSLAEQLEKAGEFTLRSKMEDIHTRIEQALNG